MTKQERKNFNRLFSEIKRRELLTKRHFKSQYVSPKYEYEIQFLYTLNKKFVIQKVTKKDRLLKGVKIREKILYDGFSFKKASKIYNKIIEKR